MAFDYSIDISEFERKWAALMPRLNKETKAGFRDFIYGFAREFAKERMASKWDQPGHDGMGTRSGVMKKEFLASPKVTGDTLGTLAASVQMGRGSSSAYAKIHETGGTITAKGKMLTVPLRDALTGAGMVKKSADKSGLSLIIRRGRGGRTIAFLGKRNAKDSSKDKLYWILRRSVTLPARLGYYSYFGTYAEKRIPAILSGIEQRMAAWFNSGGK